MYSSKPAMLLIGQIESDFIIEEEPITILPNQDSSLLTTARTYMFSWLPEYVVQFKSALQQNDMASLTHVMKYFTRCIKRYIYVHGRCVQAKKCLECAIVHFSRFYQLVTRNLNYAIYLENMSDLMAVYMDIELNASLDTREDPYTISSRFLSYWSLYLEHSTKLILDTIIKMELICPRFQQILHPFMKEVTNSIPVRPQSEMMYLRYFLVFRRWLDFSTTDNEKAKIINSAILILGAPANKLSPEFFTQFLRPIPISEVPTLLDMLKCNLNLYQACHSFASYCNTRRDDPKYLAADRERLITWEKLPVVELKTSDSGSSDTITNMYIYKKMLEDENSFDDPKWNPNENSNQFLDANNHLDSDTKVNYSSESSSESCEELTGEDFNDSELSTMAKRNSICGDKKEINLMCAGLPDQTSTSSEFCFCQNEDYVYETTDYEFVNSNRTSVGQKRKLGDELNYSQNKQFCSVIDEDETCEDKNCSQNKKLCNTSVTDEDETCEDTNSSQNKNLRNTSLTDEDETCEDTNCGENQKLCSTSVTDEDDIFEDKNCGINKKLCNTNVTDEDKTSEDTKSVEKRAYGCSNYISVLFIVKEILKKCHKKFLVPSSKSHLSGMRKIKQLADNFADEQSDKTPENWQSADLKRLLYAFPQLRAIFRILKNGDVIQPNQYRLLQSVMPFKFGPYHKFNNLYNSIRNSKLKTKWTNSSHRSSSESDDNTKTNESGLGSTQTEGESAIDGTLDESSSMSLTSQQSEHGEPLLNHRELALDNPDRNTTSSIEAIDGHVNHQVHEVAGKLAEAAEQKENKPDDGVNLYTHSKLKFGLLKLYGCRNYLLENTVHATQRPSIESREEVAPPNVVMVEVDNNCNRGQHSFMNPAVAIKTKLQIKQEIRQQTQQNKQNISQKEITTRKGNEETIARFHLQRSVRTRSEFKQAVKSRIEKPQTVPVYSKQMVPPYSYHNIILTKGIPQKYLRNNK